MWGHDLNLQPQGYEPCELPSYSTLCGRKGLGTNWVIDKHGWIEKEIFICSTSYFLWREWIFLSKDQIEVAKNKIGVPMYITEDAYCRLVYIKLRIKYISMNCDRSSTNPVIASTNIPQKVEYSPIALNRLDTCMKIRRLLIRQWWKHLTSSSRKYVSLPETIEGNIDSLEGYHED